MSRRAGGLSALALMAGVALVANACQSNTGAAGCEVSALVSLPGSPLTLLPGARLERVDGGFMLAGVAPDTVTVRWAPLDEAGALGQEQSLVLPTATAGPWLAFTAARQPGDTLLVAQATAAGGDSELHVTAVPTTGVPTPGPALVTVAGALTGGAVAFAASRSGAHALLAWASAAGAWALPLGPAGEPAGKPLLVDEASPLTCLAFASGRDAAALTYFRYPAKGAGTPELVITELGETGAVTDTLVLFLESHDAGCPRLLATPTGYALAFLDGKGAWLGVYERASNRLSLNPFASSVTYAGGVQPPLAGLAPMGADFAVVVERPRGAELWRLDGQGTRRPGTLALPSLQGAIGSVSTWGEGGLFVTYADYSSPDSGVGVDGQRIFLRASCL